MGRSRTSELTVRAARASIVFDELAFGAVARVEDIPQLPRLRHWMPSIVETAIADLVADGRISEAADGRLCVAEPEA